ncbi:lytic transglycosylase domain-containing protein [Sphingobium yanoikuyae]|jgi:hypothetical protein|uniref:Lytic transglycosylase domain-containing protein n=1 Tax=Sphingobium yanoikuyae TaxID=13690 RepID=A0AA42WPY3_SPHYA|nr:MULTISPECIES: lytic transglycosylase domain-containing protein [Sphingobium]MDH2129639.1 lytic transglycosylase domain-containing protein [Sphingobium yanoikuyae]MDH2149733.1 lytic transglycosylase domain-containing protein [Sphingobium yanoikuyae]MDH2165442.1 lytic transglycosylase domain-containing protein [Sphingobium yanoikuyae]
MMRFVPCLIGILLCGVIISPSLAQARTRNRDEERLIGACIRQASLGRPWLEKTLWGLRDQEAGWIGAEVANTNGTHDLGPLQINSWWVGRIAAHIGRPKAHVRHWLRFDPCFNAEAARWVFLSALRTTGDYWKAVGVYHSPTTWRQRNYIASVAMHLSGRFGNDVFVPGTSPATVQLK